MAETDQGQDMEHRRNEKSYEAYKRGRDCGVSVEGHVGNWWGKISGLTSEKVLIVILFLICTGFLWWGDEKRATLFISAHATTQGMVKTLQETISEANRIQAEKMDEQLYVLTRNQAERDKLNLGMPNSLRRKIGGGQ